MVEPFGLAQSAYHVEAKQFSLQSHIFYIISQYLK